MGWTNSIPIFHKNITYILKEEILKYTLSYIDDVPVKGLATQYEQKDRTCEILTSNSRIRKFIFKHLNTVNRILQYMKYTRETFLGLKTIMCSNHITMVGFDCLYCGRKPTLDTIEKIIR